MPDSAVDIVDPAAAPADQMMMIVADPRFVKGGGICGVDATHQTRLQKSVEVVVDRLPGKAPQAFTSDCSDSIGIEMPALVDRRQNRKTRRCDPHPRQSQLFLECFSIRLHSP